MDPRRMTVRFACWALTCTMFLAGCSTAPSSTGDPGPGTAAAAETDDPVVATVGGQEIHLSELEAAATDELEELDQRRYQVLLGSLTNLVRQRAIDAEAAARGLSVAELVQAEVDDKLEPVTDEDVAAFMAEGNFQAQLDQRVENAETEEAKQAVRDEFRQAVERRIAQVRRGERIEAFLAELKAAHPVDISFAPPQGTRKEVAVGDAPVRGAEDAPVTIVEFSDFECPFCGRAQSTLHELLELYPGKVRIAYKHMPLNMHPHAPKAAEAAECAREQGAFWELHDRLYANQQALAVDQLVEHAVALGLDGDALRECIDSGRMAERVRADMQQAAQLGVSSTPIFFVNGLTVKGAQPVEAFQAIIEPEIELAG